MLKTLAFGLVHSYLESSIISIYIQAECKKEVDGYPKPVYKKFSTKAEADMFISGSTMGAKKRTFNRLENSKPKSTTSKPKRTKLLVEEPKSAINIGRLNGFSGTVFRNKFIQNYTKFTSF